MIICRVVRAVWRCRLDWLFGIDLASPDGNSTRTLYIRWPFPPKPYYRWSIRLLSWKNGDKPRLENWLGRHFVWPEW